MNALLVPPTETCVKIPPAFVDRNKPWFVATRSVSAAGMAMKFTPLPFSDGLPLVSDHVSPESIERYTPIPLKKPLL